MIGETLFTEDFIQEINSEEPNIEKIKHLVIKGFNKENGTNYGIDSSIPYEQEKEIVGWLHRIEGEHPHFVMSIRRKPLLLPFISTCLSSKISSIAQFYCPFCTDRNSGLISIIPIRISAISKQASNAEKRQAFERAIATRFEDRDCVYKKGEPLCVFITFVLGKGNRNKDLDNMSKALLDALKGEVLFGEDLDIEHLNLLKIKWAGAEDFIYVNIRGSSFSQHKNVLFKSMHHNWAGAEFLDLKDFM